MSILKLSQNINFANSEALLKKITELGSRKFYDYMATLIQIQEEFINSGDAEPWSSVARLVSSQIAKANIVSLITNIGIQTFRSVAMNDIINVLSQHADGGSKPSEQPQPVAPGDKVGPAIEEYKRRTYSDDKAKEVGQLLFEAENLYDSYLQPGILSHEKRRIEILVKSLLDKIDLITVDEASKEAPPDVAEPIVPAEVGEEEVVTEEDDSGKDDKTTAPDKRITASDYDIKSALGSPLLSGWEGFVDVENKTVNPEVFKEIYTRVFSAIKQAGERAISDVISGKRSGSKALKKEINDIVICMKAFDTEAMHRSRSFSQEQEALELKSKIALNTFGELINQSDVSDESGTDLLHRLFLASVSLTRPSIAYYFVGGNVNDDTGTSQGLKVPELSGLVSSGFINQQDVDDQIYKSAMTLYKQRIKSIFNSRKVRKYFKEADNFIVGVNVGKNSIKLNVKRSLDPRGRESISWCPMCFKKIPWNKKSLRDKKPVIMHESYSPYIVKGSGLELIRERDLAGNWEPPKTVRVLPVGSGSRKYNNPYNQPWPFDGASMTWQQINELISSGDEDRQAEGIERRNYVYKSLGAKRVSSQRGASIDTHRFKCPTGEQACGLTTVASESGAVHSQPAWGGSYDNNYKPNITYEDESVAEHAGKMARGGHKFSKVSFGCPCRIDSLDSDTPKRHFDMAISSFGPLNSSMSGYGLPTTPEGSLDEALLNQGGTMGYLICGAPTSISAFDRNPASENYFVNILSKLKQESPAEYFSLIDSIIRYGVDVGDITPFLEKMDDTNIETYSSKIISRMTKIAEIVVSASFNLGKLDSIGKIGLVCPFGHKFTVEQSMRFSVSNIGLNITKGYSDKYSKVLGKFGADNVEALKKHGVIASYDYILDKDSLLEFDEWYALPEGDPRRKPSNLIFNISDGKGGVKKYVLEVSSDEPRANIFGSSEHSLEPRELIRRTFQITDRGRVQSENYAPSPSGDSPTDRSATDISQVKKWKEEMSKPDYVFEPIPGATVDGDIEEVIGSRVSAISRSVKSILRLIETWTEGIVNDDMARVLLVEGTYDISDEIKSIVSNLTFSMPEDMDSAERDAMSSRFVGMVEKDVRRHFDTLDLSWQRFDPNELATTIITKAILENREKIEELGAEEDDRFYFEFDYDDWEAGVNKVVKNYVDRDSSMADVLKKTMYSMSKGVKKTNIEKRKHQSRLFLLSSAFYLAESLSAIYRQFYTRGSPYYVGYQLGIDLYDAEQNLNIRDMDSIVSSINDFGFEDREGVFGEDGEDAMESAATMDRIYSMLKGYLNMTSHYAMFPSNLNRAKEYAIKRLSDISGMEEENVASGIKLTYPIDSFNFEAKDLKTIPLSSKARGLPSLPGTKRIVDEKGNDTGVIVNEDLNFDSSKHQLGMTGPKSLESFNWPPPAADYSDGFVGFPLPMPYVEGKALAGVAKSAITDMKIVVDIDGSREDITFLFQRGQDPKKINIDKEDEVGNKTILMSLDAKIKEHIDEFNLAGRLAKLKSRPIDVEEYSKKKIELEEQLMSELSVYHKQVKQVPYRVRTKKSAMRKKVGVAGDEWVDIPYPAMCLVNPVRAYELINNEFLSGVKLSDESKDRLVEFIKDIYSMDSVKSAMQESKGTAVEILDDELFSSSPSMSNVQLNKMKNILKKKWVDDVGSYYDIVPSGSDSYINYISESYVGVAGSGDDFPSRVRSLVREIDYMKGFADKGQEQMMKYFEESTRGKLYEGLADDNFEKDG